MSSWDAEGALLLLAMKHRVPRTKRSKSTSSEESSSSGAVIVDRGEDDLGGRFGAAGQRSHTPAVELVALRPKLGEEDEEDDKEQARPRKVLRREKNLGTQLGMAASQKSHGSIGGRVAGRIGENKFLAGTAENGRSKCHGIGCKQSISPGLARIGKKPPSLRFGHAAKTKWYHVDCMFASFKRACKHTKTIRCTEVIAGFETLRAEDQEQVYAAIDVHNSREQRPAARRRRRQQEDEDEDEYHLPAVSSSSTASSTSSSPLLGPCDDNGLPPFSIDEEQGPLFASKKENNAKAFSCSLPFPSPPHDWHSALISSATTTGRC